MAKFTPMLRYIRYKFAYQLYPVKKSNRTPDYLGEVQAWTVKEKFTPFMNFSDRYKTYEAWYLKQKQNGKENSDYVKKIMKLHEKYPNASLSQLQYKPKLEYGEKKLSEAMKTMVDENALEWELRAICDKILVARAEGNQKRYEKWENSVNIEEMAGITKQEIDELSEYDVLNKIKSLMYFENRGDDDFTDIEGNTRRGRIYSDNDIKKLVNKLTPDKKKIMKKKFGN